MPTRVLCIDDEEALCELFKVAVEAHGYAVDFTTTGEDGLAMHARQSYDLVATDYQLPDMTGIDVIRKLFIDNPFVPVLMVTGRDNEKVAAEALTLGAYNYVIKDSEAVYLELLPNVIDSALKRGAERYARLVAEQELKQAQAELESRVVERTRELQDSEARLAYAQRLARLGSWTLNLETSEVLWTDEQYRIFGYSPGEIAPSLELVIESVAPEDRALFVETVKDKMASQENNYSHEYRIVKPDGDIRHLHSTVEILRDDDGKACELSGVYQDVTEQRLIEEAKQVAEIRFRALVENSPSAIILKDTDGKYLVANKQWHTWFNPEGKDIAGNTVYDYFPSNDADDVTASDQEVIRTGQPFSREFNPPLADGRSITMMGQKFPVIDDGGTVIAVGGSYTDISELKDAHSALASALDVAERANRSKSEFLSNMSHELRTPLNGILGFSEMMKLESLGPLSTETYGEYVGMIHDAGAHLLGIISQILDVSRIESGFDDLDETRVQVRGAITFCLNNLEQRFSEYDLRISTDIADDLPDLLADKTRLEQMLTNLISNAIKYNKAGGVVKIEAKINGSESMTNVVKDSGVGIELEDINRVQDRFEQVQSSQVRGADGIGLGLPVVRLLTKLHQAEFSLESVVDEGTTATIVFPKERVIG